MRVPVPARVKSPRRPVALCLEPHDLVLAKCVAGRERDWEFAQVMLRHALVDLTELLARIPALPAGDRTRPAPVASAQSAPDWRKV